MAGYLSPQAVFIDGIHIKSSTNTKKQVKAVILVASKRYAHSLNLSYQIFYLFL